MVLAPVYILLVYRYTETWRHGGDLTSADTRANIKRRKSAAGRRYPRRYEFFNFPGVVLIVCRVFYFIFFFCLRFRPFLLARRLFIRKLVVGRQIRRKNGVYLLQQGHPGDRYSLALFLNAYNFFLSPVCRFRIYI